MASGGPYLRSLAQTRTLDWGKSWQWDSLFPTAPGPFRTWFPATEASRNISELETHSFVGFGDTFDIPFASGIRTFNVTFLDDDRGTLMQWFDDWMEFYTLNRGDSTARLANIVRPCRLAQLGARGAVDVVHEWSMQVYPFGSFSLVTNSESKFMSYMLSFRIAGLDNPRGN